MEDLKRVWNLLVAGLHTAFLFTNSVATTSSVAVGFVLVGLAALIKTFQKRRRFYAGIDVAADWEPRYGGIVSAWIAEKVFGIMFATVLFFGIMVLFKRYLPVLFDDIIGFFIRLTA